MTFPTFNESVARHFFIFKGTVALDCRLLKDFSARFFTFECTVT